MSEKNDTLVRNPVVEKQPSAVQYYSYIILLPERSFMTEKQFLRDRIPGNEMRMESFIR